MEFADEFAEAWCGPLAGDGGLVEEAVVQDGAEAGEEESGDAAEGAHAHGGEGLGGVFLKRGEGGEVAGVPEGGGEFDNVGSGVAGLGGK